jgi:putative transposase
VLYHVLNRAAKRAVLFWTEQDYTAFEGLLLDAKRRFEVRMFAYILMPNHWHFLLSPSGDRDLSRFMHWLTTTHSRRWNIAHGKCGTGAVYQSRYEAIPIQDGDHAFRVCRYIERNALRANLVARAEHWPWSSLPARSDAGGELIDPLPFALPADWAEIVNVPQTQSELDAIRAATDSESSYGEDPWKSEINSRTDRRPGRKGRPRAIVTKIVKMGSDPIYA